MVKIFNNKYFEKNASQVFRLRKALTEQCIQDKELEDEAIVRRFLRDSIGIKNRITSASCESLRDYLRSQGGVSAYLKQPAFIVNVYVALATYNLRIQDEIKNLITYSNLSTEEAQLLVSDLLGEEEIADEAEANKYRDLCCSLNYKRAEYAIKKYAPSISVDQVFLVKSYLCSYIKTGCPPKTTRSAFHLALLKNDSTIHTRSVIRSLSKSKLLTEEKEEKKEDCGLMCSMPAKTCVYGVQNPIHEVYVKVEKLNHQEIHEKQLFKPTEMAVQVDENMPIDEITLSESPEKKSIAVQTISNNEEVEDERVMDRIRLNNKRRRFSNNLMHFNKQRYTLSLKQMEIEQREAAVAARELAVELRENAVSFREKLVKRAKTLAPQNIGRI